MLCMAKRAVCSEIHTKHTNFLIYNKPTRCNSGSIVAINNKYVLHVSDALCVRHQEHYKL